MRDIGLALSGGGSRAAAFHLGCLRALQDLGVLPRVRVISAISGGSLVAALWAYGPSDFGEFDATAVRFLRRGLHSSIAIHLLRPYPAICDLGSMLQSCVPSRQMQSRVRRSGRTAALTDVLAERAFQSKTMSHVSHEDLAVVLTATDLTTGSAVRFGSERSSCSRFGTITEPVSVALAVAASAAYPLLLPAINRTFTFERRGVRETHAVLLADGGVYDNLGLTVLEPGRSRGFTEHVYDVSYIVSCDAGRGELRQRSPRFVLGRAGRAFDIVHARAQNGGRARLHEWAESGAISGFVMAYLGMRDDRLPKPVDGLVRRESVAAYPTNFAAMSQENLKLLSRRGEQLVRALLPIYCPELV